MSYTPINKYKCLHVNLADKIMRLDYKFTAEQIINEGRTTQLNVDTIKQWLEKLEDEDVPVPVQDELIVIFLLSCNNDIPLTKNTVIMYYKCKKDGPEIFDDRDMRRADLIKAMNTVHMASIPTRTDDNMVVHYFKINDTNYRNCDLVPMMKLSYMLLDISNEHNPPAGLIVVIDMKGFGLMHLTRLRMQPIKKYLQFLQEGFPIQLKVIHILNTVYFFDKIMNIIKVFMKGELMEMIKTHPVGLAQDKLFEIVPKKCLPKEYGGDQPSEKELHQITIKQYIEKKQFWDTEEAIRKK